MSRTREPFKRTPSGRRTAWVALTTISLLVTACTTSSSGGGDPSAEQPHSGGTLHATMVDPAYQGFDPQFSYTNAQYEVLNCCLQRTLMVFPGLPGFVGTVAVPDLATGPPTVSADGRTWTFHIRKGIKYAPPYQDVEVTAADFVRAIERTRLEDGPSPHYFNSLLEGYLDYAEGKADSIAGLLVVDDSTLQVRETRPDQSILALMTMPATAPIPPAPDGIVAEFGAADGHDYLRDYDHPERYPDNVGYGPFQASTGPYMIEGADQIDVAAATNKQPVPKGFDGAFWFEQPGHLTLVRNPSWSAGTDLVRPAYPDRIEISIQPKAEPYSSLLAGTTDVIFGGNPSSRQLARYQTPDRRDRVHRTESNAMYWITLNLGQPPFDDIHVRRAFALALDRTAVREGIVDDNGPVGVGPLYRHLIPNSLLDNLLVGWQPVPASSSASRLAAARAELRQSRYWKGGQCSVSICGSVRIGYDQHPRSLAAITATLRSLGMHAVIDGTQDCADAATHYGACLWGWTTDYPSAGSMLPPFIVGANFGASGLSSTATGVTPTQLRHFGFPVKHVPSIQMDYDRCNAALPVQAATCWARLDQWLTAKLVAAVPIASLASVRLAGPHVTAFSIDQAYTEPALDRIAVNVSSP